MVDRGDENLFAVKAVVEHVGRAADNQPANVSDSLARVAGILVGIAGYLGAVGWVEVDSLV
jgi:hypothetical protein